jgi:hypothetical protein
MAAKRSRRTSSVPSVAFVVLSLLGALAAGYWISQRSQPTPVAAAADQAKRAEEIAHEDPGAEALSAPADEPLTTERESAGNVKKKSR